MRQPLECPLRIPHAGQPQVQSLTQQDLVSTISRVGTFSYDQKNGMRTTAKSRDLFFDNNFSSN